MAQKIHVVLIDDIDGSEASETVEFGLDGTNYVIDLNDAHASALREALAPYTAHGRRVAAGRRTARRGSGGGANPGEPSAREIREWARAHGHEVPDRGRVSAEVRAAYAAAH